MQESFLFQDESGAQITIGKPEPKNPGDRVITIKVRWRSSCLAALVCSGSFVASCFLN